MSQEEDHKKHTFVMLVDDSEEDTFLFQHAAKKAREDINTCYAEGAAGYLVKPSGNKELVLKLQQVLAYWIDAMEPTHS